MLSIEKKIEACEKCAASTAKAIENIGTLVGNWIGDGY